MSSAPEIVTRPEQPYVRDQGAGDHGRSSAAVVPPLNQEVFAWLGEQAQPRPARRSGSTT